MGGKGGGEGRRGCEREGDGVRGRGGCVGGGVVL